LDPIGQPRAWHTAPPPVVQPGFVLRLYKLRRTATARRKDAQEAGDQSPVQRRRGSFPADVAEGDQGVSIALLEKVVHVARNFTRRARSNSHLDSLNFRGFAR